MDNKKNGQTSSGVEPLLCRSHTAPHVRTQSCPCLLTQRTHRHVLTKQSEHTMEKEGQKKEEAQTYTDGRMEWTTGLLSGS